MKIFAIVLASQLLAACTSLAIFDVDPEQQAARNRCEAMRSYRPYYPNECGELNSAVPFGYGVR